MVDTICDADEFMPDMAIGSMPTSDGGERANNRSKKFLKGRSAGG
ncbi:hypothetical protein [Kordiimonas sediminis]|nr:hypothetical protein [Kordiimonas sediminis]